MRQMFTQIFSAITTLFGAVERGANSLDNLARWAEEETATFADQSAIERQQKIRLLEAA